MIGGGYATSTYDSCPSNGPPSSTSLSVSTHRRPLRWRRYPSSASSRQISASSSAGTCSRGTPADVAIAVVLPPRWTADDLRQSAGAIDVRGTCWCRRCGYRAGLRRSCGARSVTRPWTRSSGASRAWSACGTAWRPYRASATRGWPEATRTADSPPPRTTTTTSRRCSTVKWEILDPAHHSCWSCCYATRKMRRSVTLVRRGSASRSLRVQRALRTTHTTHAPLYGEQSQHRLTNRTPPTSPPSNWV